MATAFQVLIHQLCGLGAADHGESGGGQARSGSRGAGGANSSKQRAKLEGTKASLCILAQLWKIARAGDAGQSSFRIVMLLQYLHSET